LGVSSDPEEIIEEPKQPLKAISQNQKVLSDNLVYTNLCLECKYESEIPKTVFLAGTTKLDFSVITERVLIDQRFDLQSLIQKLPDKE